MKAAITFILFLFIGVAKGQTFREMDSCRNAWKYIRLKKPVTGIILFRREAPGECGTMATASLTIIQLENNKVIRVLSICDTDSSFQTGQAVKISGLPKPNFDVSLPMELVEFPGGDKCYNVDYKDCEVLETYYGELKKVNSVRNLKLVVQDLKSNKEKRKN